VRCVLVVFCAPCVRYLVVRREVEEAVNGYKECGYKKGDEGEPNNGHECRTAPRPVADVVRCRVFVLAPSNWTRMHLIQSLHLHLRRMIVLCVGCQESVLSWR
jgi:hypothetical protein